MTGIFNQPDLDKLHVYGSILLMVMAWSAIALAVGGAFALASSVLYALTLGGILAILGFASRHPRYLNLRDRQA